MAGRFREDLLARINLWTFRLPNLRERPEDIEPNLEYELEQCARTLNLRLTMSREARGRFLDFSTSKVARWTGNFRDFNAAFRRMATLSNGGRIGVDEVAEEVERLRAAWQHAPATHEGGGESRASGGRCLVRRFLGEEKLAELDEFDRVQLDAVLRVCLDAPTLSEAGRQLFGASRARKKAPNDADRLRKYLARFGLEWADLHGRNGP